MYVHEPVRVNVYHIHAGSQKRVLDLLELEFTGYYESSGN